MDEKGETMDMLRDLASTLSVYSIQESEFGDFRFVRSNKTDRIANAREFIKIYDYLNSKNI